MRRTMPKRLPFLALSVAVVAVTVPSASAAISRQQAYQLGRQGKTTSYILRKAFPNVRLSRQIEAPIRVLLADDVRQVVVMSQVAMLLKNGANPSAPTYELVKGHRYEVTRAGTLYKIKDLEDSTAAAINLGGPPVFDSRRSGKGIRLAEPRAINRRYRGMLRVQAGRGVAYVQVVNVVDAEAYLRGTLPGDMPARWGVRAPSTLKAGAVALRSRALAQRKLATAPFDFTASDPKYLGLDGERPRTNIAVTKTRNLTLRQGKWPYPASFSGLPAMGSSAFQPRPGHPVPVAFGPASKVDVDTSVGTGTVDDRVLAAMNLALTYLGKPYLWGGQSPSTGFDCSGLLYYVFGQQGIRIPRVAEDQAKVGAPIRRMGDLLPGDAVFFADSSGYIHHIGIYIGDGKMVHSPSTGDVVKISVINTGYYLRQFAGGRRYK